MTNLEEERRRAETSAKQLGEIAALQKNNDQLKAQVGASAAATKAAKDAHAAADVKIANALAIMDSAQKDVLLLMAIIFSRERAGEREGGRDRGRWVLVS